MRWGGCGGRKGKGENRVSISEKRKERPTQHGLFSPFLLLFPFSRCASVQCGPLSERAKSGSVAHCGGGRGGDLRVGKARGKEKRGGKGGGARQSEVAKGARRASVPSSAAGGGGGRRSGASRRIWRAVAPLASREAAAESGGARARAARVMEKCSSKWHRQFLQSSSRDSLEFQAGTVLEFGFMWLEYNWNMTIF